VQRDEKQGSSEAEGILGWTRRRKSPSYPPFCFVLTQNLATSQKWLLKCKGTRNQEAVLQLCLDFDIFFWLFRVYEPI